MSEASPIEWLPAPPDDHEYDDGADQAFYRRLPLVVDSVLRARRLDAIVTSIVQGAEYVCPGAAARLDNLDPAAVSEDTVAAEQPAHVVVHGADTSLRRRSSMRRTGAGLELVIRLIAQGAQIAELVIEREGEDAWFRRQEREHLRVYAELTAPALHSCLALRELRRMALTDQLTGVANRRALDRELDAVASRGRPLAVVLIDADGLRVVNNTIGYHAGDALISLLAQAVRTAAAGHFVARLGGDEFVVLVEGDRAARAEQLCDAIGAAFDPSPLAPEIRALRPGASAGAVVAGEGEQPREVLRRAGERMHAEKRRRKADRGRIE